VNEPVWQLVTVDIDGTLTKVHGWRVIADAVGRTAEYEATQRRFLAREIGEDEHLREMLDMVEGRRLEEVERALAATPRIEGIADGIRRFHQRGARVALLTHNPPFVCEWYCRQFGFDGYDGTGAQEVVAGVIQAPHDVTADKPAGVRALSARFGVPLPRVVHIGDGWADAVLFPLVGGGVALNSTLPEVNRAADLALCSSDFREVADAVEALDPRR
jgi:phosphoserine phosphatase